MKDILNIHNPEINDNFNAEIDVLTGKREIMGIVELIAEERAKEAVKEVKKEVTLENKRFFTETLLQNTEFSAGKIASLAGVTESFVEEVKANLLKK
jgi:hypothetical protein